MALSPHQSDSKQPTVLLHQIGVHLHQAQLSRRAAAKAETDRDFQKHLETCHQDTHRALWLLSQLVERVREAADMTGYA